MKFDTSNHQKNELYLHKSKHYVDNVLIHL
jgi:hypothetical protein